MAHPNLGTGSNLPPGPDGTGGTPPGTQPPGAGSPPPGLDKTKLNPILQGMENEEQINDLFSTMMDTIRSRQAPPQNREVPPPPVAPPEPDYKAMMDPNSDQYNPRAAVLDITARNYGGVMTDISTRANEGLFLRFRDEFSDFKEHEADIRELLKSQPNLVPDAKQIAGLYYAAKGYRQTLKEKQDQHQRTRAPSPPVLDEPVKAKPLPDDEARVARSMFRHEQDPEAAYRTYVDRLENGDTTMKVPLSGGTKR